MKRYFSVFILLVLTFGSTFAAVGRYSLKDFKNALKSDSSEAANAELAKKVIVEGVSFEYTSARESDLRKWGANDVLIAAVWQSILDERDEKRMYDQFFSKQTSSDKDVRREAIGIGEAYLARFETNVRFRENAAKVRKELGYLRCEFDPSLGC